MSGLTDILLNLNADIKSNAVKYIKSNPESYSELKKLAFSDKQPEAWRSAWVLYTIVENDKEKLNNISKKVEKIIDNLPEFNSPGQKREFLKILLLIDIPKKYMGKLINLCFDWLMLKKTDVSFKVYTMQLIYNYSLKEPDLQQELKAVLEEIKPYSSKGIVCRTLPSETF